EAARRGASAPALGCRPVSHGRKPDRFGILTAPPPRSILLAGVARRCAGGRPGGGHQMRRFGFVSWPAVTVLVLVVGAGVAIGAVRGLPVTIHDPKGDAVAGHADIATIGAAAAAGKITWTIGTYTSFTTKFKPAPHAIQWRAEVRALKGCYPRPCDQTAFGRTSF